MARRARKRKKRTPYQKLKKETSDWMSRYVRLRDALEHKKDGYPIGYVMCYTCPTVEHIKHMQAGHFRTRGLGGSSGIYFDTRSVHTQCVQCNAFRQGCPDEFERHLILDYGEEAVEQMKVQHKLPGGYTTERLTKLLLYFQIETERLLEELQIEQWW